LNSTNGLKLSSLKQTETVEIFVYDSGTQAVISS